MTELLEVDQFFCSLHPWERDAIVSIDTIMPHPANALPELAYLIAIGALADPAQAARRAAFEAVYHVTRVEIPILPDGFEVWYEFDWEIWFLFAVSIDETGAACSGRGPIWDGPWSN